MYSKIGRAKYISHLDLSATIRRGLLRAGIALKYSEGFNPHPYISVALPLPVGAESLCELLDIRALPPFSLNGWPDLINAVLPDGLHVHEAYESDRKFRDIAWIGLICSLYYDPGLPAGLTDELQRGFASGEIVIQKKTKRGVSKIDIAPYIMDVGFDEVDSKGLSVSLKVSAQDPSIVPEDIFNAIRGWDIAGPPDFTASMRTGFYDKGMKVFR